MSNRTGNSMSPHGNEVDYSHTGLTPAGLGRPPQPATFPVNGAKQPAPQDYVKHGPELSELEKPKPATPQKLLPPVESYATQGELASVDVPDGHQPTDRAPTHPGQLRDASKTGPPIRTVRTAWVSGQPYSAYENTAFPTSAARR
jgi:hypothetical protein